MEVRIPRSSVISPVATARSGTKTVTGESLSALLFVVVNKKDIMHRHISVARVLLQGTGGPLRVAGPLGASRRPPGPTFFGQKGRLRIPPPPG